MHDRTIHNAGQLRECWRQLEQWHSDNTAEANLWLLNYLHLYATQQYPADPLDGFALLLPEHRCMILQLAATAMWQLQIQEETRKAEEGN